MELRITSLSLASNKDPPKKIFDVQLHVHVLLNTINCEVHLHANRRRQINETTAMHQKGFLVESQN